MTKEVADLLQIIEFSDLTNNCECPSCKMIRDYVTKKEKC